MEVTTGEILYQKDPHKRLAPASMTKIMSMMLILEDIKSGGLTWDEKNSGKCKCCFFWWKSNLP